MLDDFFASVSVFAESCHELFGVEPCLWRNFERINNRVAQMLQQGTHTRDDDFRSVVLDAPQNFEALAHGFTVRADSLEGQSLPGWKQRNIALGQECEKIIAQLIGHHARRCGDDDDLIFGALHETSEQQRPRVVGADY